MDEFSGMKIGGQRKGVEGNGFMYHYRGGDGWREFLSFSFCKF